jgi:hypothetical protein
MLVIVLLSLAACQSAMIPMPNLYNQPINSKLSDDESREAIKSGTISAGWGVDNVSDGQMIATYRIREHTVIVSIGYSGDRYGIFYKNSMHMKVKCGTRPAYGGPSVTTGQPACPGGTVPTHIHENYEDWINGLNSSIQAALQSACYTNKKCR